MLFSFFNDSFRFRLNSIHHRIHLYSSNPFNHQQIISESNNKIKLMKSLDNIKGREKLSCVRLEGHRQIIDAVQNGLNPKIILYTFRSIDEAIKGNKIHQELYQILKSCQPDIVNEVTEPLMQSISNTVTNQGVIAAFDKPSPIKTIPFSRSQIPSLILVLDGISDPGNLGTIIRSAAGFGVNAVILIKGCDPWSPKVIRSTMGLILQIPLLNLSWKEIENQISMFQKSLTSTNSLVSSKKVCIYYADSSSSNSKAYYNHEYRDHTIIVIGSEANGISDEGLEMKKNLNVNNIFIPMEAHVESLNAAIAGSIILSEIKRQRLSVSYNKTD